MELNKKLNRAIIAYEQAFLNQMGFDEEISETYWASRPGTILFINDYFFSFEDMRLIVDNDIPKEKVFEWYNYSVENESKINLKSYLSGARDKFKVYLSVPISGRPLWDAMSDFIKAKILIIDAGHTPVSPMDEITFDNEWIDYIEIDIEKLSHCDRIWFFSPLPDSNGVRIEKAIVKNFGIKEFKLK